MAHVYIDSNAAGSGTGADWANAYTTIGAALSAKAAGDNFWVAHNHAESAAAGKTLTSPGTAASPCTVICVNSGGSVPPVAADIRTTATVTTTGANNMTINGYAYYYGITFNAGTGAIAMVFSIGTTTGDLAFEDCNLNNLNTNGNSAAFTIGASNNNPQRITLQNVNLKFGSAASAIRVNGGYLRWRGGSIDSSGTAPTTAFNVSQGPSSVLIEGVDLSFVTGTLFGSSNNSASHWTIKDCKLGSGVTVASAGSGPGAHLTDVIRSDNADTHYRSERYDYTGTLTTETTIVRTGGATDGETIIAWKIVTTANAEWIAPFEAPPIAIWNDTTGSAVTVTIYGIWGGGAVPNNDEIWIDVAYPGTSGVPKASFATSNKANYLATAAAVGSDSSSWGGSTTAFKLTATFTPQEKGPITVYLRAAKTSSTFYIDPKPEISGVTVSKSLILSPGVFANELSSGGSSGGLLAHPGMRGGFV